MLLGSRRSKDLDRDGLAVSSISKFSYLLWIHYLQKLNFFELPSLFPNIKSLRNNLAVGLSVPEWKQLGMLIGQSLLTRFSPSDSLPIVRFKWKKSYFGFFLRFGFLKQKVKSCRPSTKVVFGSTETQKYII